ncbi:hypothetical protein MMC22_009622 [Lobaria immixta]|nr:hypothetical protein [Lobaria immixta]
MMKLLVIQGPKPDSTQPPLFKAVESEILRKYEVYASESTIETINLLEKHVFKAVLSAAFDRQQENLHMRDLLAKHIQTGGTLILTPGTLGLFQSTIGAKRPNFNSDFGRKASYNQIGRHYVLNPSFENVFGLYVLDRSICTTGQLVGDFSDSQKIYQSTLDSSCAVAFVEHGEGFIVCLGDTPEVPAVRTLLLAMLDHAFKPSTPSPASTLNPSILIPRSSTAAFDASGESAQLPHLMDANPSCIVCRVLVPAKKCGRCRLTQYCSTKCQTADWKSHQAMCVASEDEDVPSIASQMDLADA